MGYFEPYEPEKKEIWVRRDDGAFEYKIWFIFSFEFIGSSQGKLGEFINYENNRYHSQNYKANDLMESSDCYHQISTTNTILPPRLIAIPEEKLIEIETELTPFGNFMLGDSVGGISPLKPPVHNEKLSLDIDDISTIIFSPGVLARIIVEIDGKKNYLFQLALKNLKRKGDVFYKPIGGHIKTTSDAYETLIKKYKLTPKDRKEFQDTHDVSFLVRKENLQDLSELFISDIFRDKTYKYFENPRTSITRELIEELGPVDSSDGITLLDMNDLALESDD